MNRFSAFPYARQVQTGRCAGCHGDAEAAKPLYSRTAAAASSGDYGGNEGFIGISDKFGRRYLFTEYHWDQGPPFGTALPLDELEPCPKQLTEQSDALFAWLVDLETRSELARPRMPDRRSYPKK